MKFKMSFDMDNYAFEDDPEGSAADLLENTAEKIRHGDMSGSVMDYNGNRVGSYAITGRGE